MISLRLFKNRDLPIILDLENHFNHINELEFISQYVENPLIHIYVIEFNNDFIGYMIIWLDEDKLQIYSLYIKEDFRHSGYAFQALILLEKTMVKQGVLEWTLEVRESNQNAIKLYHKFGFKTISIRKDYYDNHENALFMYKKN